MDFDLQAGLRVMAREHDPRYNVDYLLTHARKGLQDRIGDARWQGGQALVVDFSDQNWVIDGATDIRRVSAYRCLSQVFDLFSDLANENYDLIVLNLLPSWGDLPQLAEQVHQRLNGQGLFAFSCFGPDTLVEVVKAWAVVDDHPHIHSFVDMHDQGDGMLQLGLSRPVVDTERVTINYPGYQALVRDLRASGFTNIHASRRKSLTGKHRYARFRETLQEWFGPYELSVTFEFIFGLGFMQGQQSIKVQPPQL